MFKHLIVAGAVAVALIVSAPGARAAENLYGVVSIDNPTNQTIHYAVRWGDTAAWEWHTLEPNHYRVIWYDYPYANYDRSPVPYIKYDSDLTPAVQWRVEPLSPYAEPYPDLRDSHEYRFYTSGTYLGLQSVN
jgi:hypothetical protein